VSSWSTTTSTSYNWYDPATSLLQIVPKMSNNCNTVGLCVIKDQFVCAIGSNNDEMMTSDFVEMLDVSFKSPCWVLKDKLLVSQSAFGISILDNCIYAVSYANKLPFSVIKILYFIIIYNNYNIKC